MSIVAGDGPSLRPWPPGVDAPDEEAAHVVLRLIDQEIERAAPAPVTPPAPEISVALIGFGRSSLRTASRLLNSGASVTWVASPDPAFLAERPSAERDSQSWLAHPNHGPWYLLSDPRRALATADVVLVGTPRPYDPPAARLVAMGRACALLVPNVSRGQTIIVTGSCYVGCVRDLLIVPLRERGLVVGRDVNLTFCPEWRSLAASGDCSAFDRIVREARAATFGLTGRGTSDPLPQSEQFEQAIQTMEEEILGNRRDRRLETIAKRAFDVLVTCAALVILAPILLLVALAIFLDDGRPILFTQTRVGKDGRLFKCRKFRTMVDGAESTIGEVQGLNQIRGPAFQIEQDPRRTRLGCFLRKSSLDELPQLWNVLRGEMSLVGPRPAPPCEASDYEPWHRRRLCVKPGITGLAQTVARRYWEFDQKAYLDATYVDEWSIAVDFRILLRTVPVVLRMTGR